MNSRELISQIDNFKNARILVIGDIMLDHFIYGEVNRISPEAPVPVFKFKESKEILGGAGNVVANLASLGCQVKFLGIVGKDENGKKISALLSKTGANSHLLKLNNYDTTSKTRLISKGNHILRFDKEEKLPIIDSLIPRFEKILSKVLNTTDVVLLSDYNKGLLTNKTTQIIIENCNKLGKKVIVDPKGLDYSKYNNCYLLKPNLKEFAEATNQTYNPKDGDFMDKVKKGAEHLFLQHQIQNLVITLSEYGMLHISPNNVNDIYRVNAVSKEVFDVTGAGDTTIATLAACIAIGLDFKKSIYLSNIAAGVAVGKLGTATVSNNEVKAALMAIKGIGKTNIDAPSSKIVAFGDLVDIIEKLKKQEKTIGFTNGCFDCCHLGHLKSFIRTKELCDVLVVAINADASIKRYKGNDRPIQDEQTRIALVSSLEFVDYCILFTEDTPLDIVKAIRPDVIAKEGYTIDKWVEAQFVQSYGGKVVTLEKVEGYSTTNLVNKIKNSGGQQ